MNSILNVVFAWLSLIMIVLLCALFPLSKLLEQKKYKDHNKMIALKCFLKKIHKPLGILVIIVMFMHGKLSGKRPGLEAIIILSLSILLLYSYCLKRKFPNGWKQIHKALTILLIIAIFIHIIIALN